jgi:hypothetical protein
VLSLVAAEVAALLPRIRPGGVLVSITAGVEAPADGSIRTGRRVMRSS